MQLPVVATAIVLAAFTVAPATAEEYDSRIDALAEKYESAVIGWRHDIHQNPELSNREFRTAKLIADHLRKLKFDVVTTDIAPTGVVGILRHRRPEDFLPRARPNARISHSRIMSRASSWTLMRFPSGPRWPA